MAHLRALEATGDARYEQSAKELWTFITAGWNDYEGGGMPWNHEDRWEAPVSKKGGLRAELSGCILMESMALLKNEGYVQ